MLLPAQYYYRYYIKKKSALKGAEIISSCIDLHILHCSNCNNCEHAPIMTTHAVAEALSLLDLQPSTSSVPTTGAAYAMLAGTLAEELDVNREHQLDPSQDDFERCLESFLEDRGYTGGAEERLRVLLFLAEEVMTARILGASVKQDGPISEDEALAGSVSRLCCVLGVGAVEPTDLKTPAEMAALIGDLTVKMGKLVEDGAKLGVPLIDAGVVDGMTDAQMRECERINDALRKEHLLRRGLLLKRLAVTVQSFSYSTKVDAGAFENIERGVEGAVVAGERDITVFDALAAKDWVLEFDRVSGSDGAGLVASQIKQVLMGSVPDRGGRVGAAAAAAGDMPKFQERSNTPSRGGRGGGRAGRGRRGGKKR